MLKGAVIEEVEHKRQDSARGRWKVKMPHGKVVIVRDVLERIAGWLRKSREMGGIVLRAQTDLIHTWLPWAAIRFLLRMEVSDIELFGAIVHDCGLCNVLYSWWRDVLTACI